MSAMRLSYFATLPDGTFQHTHDQAAYGTRVHSGLSTYAVEGPIGTTILYQRNGGGWVLLRVDVSGACISHFVCWPAEYHGLTILWQSANRFVFRDDIIKEIEQLAPLEGVQ